LALSGGIISLILGFVISKLTGVSNYEEILLTSFGVTLASLVLFSILLPIIFKMGTEKARIIMLIIFALPSILVTVLSKYLKDLAITPFIVLIIVFLSYNLSVSILNKKEF